MAKNGLLVKTKKAFIDFFKIPTKTRETEMQSKVNVSAVVKTNKNYSESLNVNMGSDTETVDDSAILIEKTEPDIFSAMQIRTAAVMSLNVDIKGEGEPAEFIKNWWDNLDNKYNSTRAVLHSAITRGFGVLEKQWKFDLDSGKWIISDLISHSIRHFDFNEDNELVLLSADIQDKKLDEERYFSVLTFMETDQNRHGNSLFEKLYWYWYIKNNVMKFWVIFEERMVNPNIVISHGKIDPLTEEKIVKFLEEQMTGASLKIPAKDVTVDVIHKITTAEINSYESLARYCDMKFQMMIIGNTASGDKKGGGISFDVGTLAQAVRADIQWSDVKFYETWFNKEVIQPQVLINFPGTKPRETWFDIMIGKSINPDVFRNVVTDIHNTGTDLPKDHVFEVFGIPTIRKGDPIIKGKAAEPAAAPRQNFMDIDSISENYLTKLRESIGR